jgi:hypothetical protein
VYVDLCMDCMYAPATVTTPEQLALQQAHRASLAAKREQEKLQDERIQELKRAILRAPGARFERRRSVGHMSGKRRYTEEEPAIPIGEIPFKPVDRKKGDGWPEPGPTRPLRAGLTAGGYIVPMNIGRRFASPLHSKATIPPYLQGPAASPQELIDVLEATLRSLSR